MKNIIKTFVLASLVSWQAHANTDNKAAGEQLLSKLITWAQGVEHKGLTTGRPLNEAELVLAKDIGIKAPELVRVIVVDTVPYPAEDPALKAMGESLGLIGEGIVNNAQVFGYSIYVRKDYQLDRPRMAHELVHVLQIERASFAEVIMQHVSDMSKYSYKDAPLEAEAFKANKKYAIK